MNNAIEINGITITATFAKGLVSLSFAKDGKVVKTVETTETFAKANLSKIVRPESMHKVLGLVAVVSASDEAKAYWAAQKADADAYEAKYQERTGNYEAHKRMMDRTMSVQG